MIEIARIMTFATVNRHDIVRRLMGCCKSFKKMVGWLYTTIVRIEVI